MVDVTSTEWGMERERVAESKCMEEAIIWL